MAIRFGCYAGIVPLVFAAFIAIGVAMGGQSSPEAWIFIGVVDTQMNLLLLLPLEHYIPRFDLWPRISFLPGHLSSWDYWYCFFYFLVLGTTL